MLIPVDPDLPIMGGKVLRVNAGLELAYANERPIVKLRGVSIMGVPLPSACIPRLFLPVQALNYWEIFQCTM